MTPQQKITEAIEILLEVEEIKRRPMQAAILDMHEWMGLKLDRAVILLQEAWTELNPDHPDQQQILNAEINQAIEGGSPHAY